jgi:glycosyltransferase involved in cell wall biosynthesis
MVALKILRFCRRDAIIQFGKTKQMAFGLFGFDTTWKREMRILQISSATSFAGGERHVVDVTNALAARGHELFAALRPNSPLTSHLHIPGQNIKTLPLRNALDAQSARQLSHILAQSRIDIVHAHMARDYSVAAYAVRRHPSAKLVVTRHVLFPLNRLHKRTLSYASRIVAVSSAVGRQLTAQKLFEPQKIVVIRNGINADKFINMKTTLDRTSNLRTLGIPDDCLLVGSIGELRALKRHDDFIRAAALVAAKVPSAHFVIAGVDTSTTGEVLKQLEALVVAHGLRERIHFLGWLDDAAPLLGSMDLFVSASETESFGLAIAEAMASGTAVVSTATEGASELIVEGETGLLVPIGDVERMANAISSLLLDEHKRQQFGIEGQRVVSKEFSLDRMVDELEGVYNSILAGTIQ